MFCMKIACPAVSKYLVSNRNLSTQIVDDLKAMYGHFARPFVMRKFRVAEWKRGHISLSDAKP